MNQSVEQLELFYKPTLGDFTRGLLVVMCSGLGSAALWAAGGWIWYTDGSAFAMLYVAIAGMLLVSMVVGVYRVGTDLLSQRRLVVREDALEYYDHSGLTEVAYSDVEVLERGSRALRLRHDFGCVTVSYLPRSHYSTVVALVEANLARHAPAFKRASFG